MIQKMHILRIRSKLRQPKCECSFITTKRCRRGSYKSPQIWSGISTEEASHLPHIWLKKPSSFLGSCENPVIDIMANELLLKWGSYLTLNSCTTNQTPVNRQTDRWTERSLLACSFPKEQTWEFRVKQRGSLRRQAASEGFLFKIWGGYITVSRSACFFSP